MAFQGFVIRTPRLHVEGMALFPFILIKRRKASKILLNHEQIHLRQQLELGLIPFYLLYLGEYLIKLIIYRNHLEAYFNISFEREAFLNESNLSYLKARKHYSFVKYFRSKSSK